MPTPGDDPAAQVAALREALRAQGRVLELVLGFANLARCDLDHAIVMRETHGPNAPVADLLERARSHLQAIARRSRS
jgi:hypothetical protein